MLARQQIVDSVIPIIFLIAMQITRLHNAFQPNHL